MCTALSEDAKQNRLDNSSGQALEHIPGSVSTLRLTLSTSRLWIDLFNRASMKPTS